MYFFTDIFYTYANEATRKSGTVFTVEETKKLIDYEHNLGDWMLYQHFNKTFWKKVDSQEMFNEEVNSYDNIIKL